MKNHEKGGLTLSRRKQTAPCATARALWRMGVCVALWWGMCHTPAHAGTLHAPFSGSYFFVPSQTVAGGIPNAMPFTETFDLYPVNSGFTDSTNGWIQNISDASRTVAVTELPVTHPSPSQFSGTCLSLDTEGETLYNATTGRTQNVWIDLSAVLVPCEELPWEEMTSGNQFGLCLDSDNRLNVYCGLTNGFIASGIQFAPAPGKAARITLQIAYADNLTVPYFRVSVDQTNVVWDAGYRLPENLSANGGAWLPCATTNRTFHGLGLAGWGYVDTLSFSDTYLGVDGQPQVGITRAAAISWLSDYGRLYQVETCEDLEKGEWQSLGDPIRGGGMTNTVFDAVGSSSRKFYRVTPL